MTESRCPPSITTFWPADSGSSATTLRTARKDVDTSVRIRTTERSTSCSPVSAVTESTGTSIPSGDTSVGRSGDPRGAEQDAALLDPEAGGHDAEIDFAERVGAWVEARAREAGVEEVPDLVGFLSELAERMGAAELSEGGPGDAGDQGAALMAGTVAEHAGGPDLWFA